MNASQLLTKNEKSYSYWIKKNWYYHITISHLLQSIVPREVTILHIGCKNGFILHALQPSVGVGFDYDESCLNEARSHYPHFTFINDLESASLGTFDYIVVNMAVMECNDVQKLFLQLKKFCHEGSKIVIDIYSFLWEPILWCSQKLRLRRATVLKNWLSLQDLCNFLYLADYEVITTERALLMPLYFPILSWIINTYVAPLPLINYFCLSQFVIARPKSLPRKEDYSVSVIIPCRNEKGNILSAVERCPAMGTFTEIIFVEGHSSDGTLQEIERVKTLYPEKSISVLVQPGKGKGDAVRKGFAAAQGDILMILDADLTMPPEELPKFFKALAEGKGEFINGSRLVYGMESKAMRFLNMIANFCFARGFSWLLGQSIKDTLCGTKVLFKKDYKNIEKNRSYFGEFDPFGDFDLLFGAAKLNLKIIDMPIHYKNRSYGTTQISRFRHGVLLLCMSVVALKKFKFK